MVPTVPAAAVAAGGVAIDVEEGAEGTTGGETAEEGAAATDSTAAGATIALGVTGAGSEAATGLVLGAAAAATAVVEGAATAAGAGDCATVEAGAAWVDDVEELAAAAGELAAAPVMVNTGVTLPEDPMSARR